LTCTGAQSQEALSKLDLLFAGCSFRTETAQPPNSAAPLVEDLKIGGAPVDLNRSYTVAVADYLFWMKPLLKDMPYRDTGERVDTLLAKYLHGLGVLRGTPWR
jgi:hypothetical protein